MDKTISAEYELLVDDFRKASYYVLFLRKRMPLLLMFLAIAAAVLYAVGCYLLGRDTNALPLLIAAAYAVWGLVLFAQNEKRIRQYIKSDSSMIGANYVLIIERDRLLVKVAEREISFSLRLNKLESAIEMSSMFLLFQNAEDFYILPRRALDSEALRELRARLTTSLKERFVSRFA